VHDLAFGVRPSAELAQHVEVRDFEIGADKQTKGAARRAPGWKVDDLPRARLCKRDSDGRAGGAFEVLAESAAGLRA